MPQNTLQEEKKGGSGGRVRVRDSELLPSAVAHCCSKHLHAALHLRDKLPAFPQCQLELTEVALGNLFALLQGAYQMLERVSFVFERLCAVLETARRKERSQALRRCGLLGRCSRLRHDHLDLLRRRSKFRRRIGACGGGWLLLLHVEEDAAADADAAAERKQAANCVRGTRRAAQDQQGGTPVAVRAACERVLDCKGAAHPRRR